MYDVIIVGARVAGAPLGRLLALRGLKVLIVDKADFPSDVISTHFLHPRANSYLKRWGLLNRILTVGTPSWTAANTRIEDVLITGEIELDAIRNRLSRAHGWRRTEELECATNVYMAPRRHVMDPILAEAAAEGGGEVRTGVIVEDLLTENDRVVGVRCRTRDGNVFEERAHVVVGADGRHSFVARKVKPERLKERLKCGFAYYTYFSGVDVSDIVWPNWCGKGRLASVAYDTSEDLIIAVAMGPREWFHEFRRDVPGNHMKVLEFTWPELAERIRASGTREDKFYGAADQPGFLNRAWGPGWALVGDAGYQKDQCTASGITHAFRDVEFLSQALVEGLGGKRPLDEALADYQAKRDADSEVYFDYVCTQAEFNIISQDELALVGALRGNQWAMNGFEGVIGDANPVEEFFSDENVGRIFAEADGSLPTPELLTRYDEQVKAYSENPFAR